MQNASCMLLITSATSPMSLLSLAAPAKAAARVGGQIFAFNAIFEECSPSIGFIRSSSSLNSQVFAAGQSLFHFATNAYDIMIKCVFTCLDIALQHIFNFLLRQHHLQPPDELFEHGNHSSAIESISSSLPNTKDDNDPIIFHEAIFFTTRHVPRTLLVEKGEHRLRPASTSPSTWCARQCHYCVRKDCPRLERARPNLHSRTRSALQDRRPLDHGMGACEGACLAGQRTSPSSHRTTTSARRVRQTT